MKDAIINILALVCVFGLFVASVLESSYQTFHDVSLLQVNLCWIVSFASGMACIFLCIKRYRRGNYYHH
jgi:hypothetical protein